MRSFAASHSGYGSFLHVIFTLLFLTNVHSVIAQKAIGSGSDGPSSDTVLDLGTIPAAQAAEGFGIDIGSGGFRQDWQFAAAKAMGAKWVRIQCSWNDVEQQAAPPQNAPANPRYVQDPNCVAALTSAAKYGLHVTEVAAYGPPFHQILYVTVPTGANTGDTSLRVAYQAGIGGETLANVRPIYDYICPVALNDDGFAGKPYRCTRGMSNRGGPPGVLITGVHRADNTHLTVDLASALTDPLPTDVRSPGGCSMTAGSTTLTCTNGIFDRTWDHGIQIRVPGAGPRGADLTTFPTAVTSATQLTLRRAAATTVQGVAVGANRLYAIGEILYPSTATNRPDDPSVIAYSDYATFLAQDLASRGLSGDIEIWNEPPWRNDSWDYRPGLYDGANTGPYKPAVAYPKGAAASQNGTLYVSLQDRNRGNDPASSPQYWSTKIPSTVFPGDPVFGANFGFAANLQHRHFPAGVTATWNGTSGSGNGSLLGPLMRTYSGEALMQPPTVVTRESFHPYGGPHGNPEEAMMLPSCLKRAAVASANIFQKGASCYLPGERPAANLMQAVELDLAAKSVQARSGLGHSITETNNEPPERGYDLQQARSNVRQFLGFEALGVSPVEFFQLWDGGQHNPTFSFVTYDGRAAKPLPSGTALSGLLTDLRSISGTGPVQGARGGLTVSHYQGTYPLMAAHLQGTRPGATAASEMLAVWQLSAAPGFTGSVNGNTLQVTALNSGWNTLGPNQRLQGRGIPDGTTITAVQSGNGGPGTYKISGGPLSIAPEDMDVSWFTLPPSSGTVTVDIPSGMKVTAVVNTVTRASVAHTAVGQHLTLQVGDDPVEILADPQ